MFQRQVYRDGRSSDPARVADDTAEVAALEPGILICKYVGLDIAERGFRLLVNAIVKCLDNIFFETGRARICVMAHAPS